MAIYMNGICQEFYNAVRGRGIYKLIKALTDADIVVDIISGTSAGGVNGVLLSYAVEWGSLNNRIVSQKKPEKDKAHSPAQQNNNKLSEIDIDDDPGEGYRIHFVDGGVLDNRPFSYTIKEIYHRAADRPVYRKIFYVDPSPDRFKGNPKYENMLKPDIVQVVQDSLIAMPRYESINNDLQLINEHNEKVRRYKFLLADLESLLDTEKDDRENNDFYDQQRNVYLRTRLISLEDKILPLIFLESEGLVKTSKRDKNSTLKEKVAKLLAEPFTDPQSSSERLKLLGRLEKEICDLDVDYALRRYFFITEYVYRLLDEEYLSGWLNNKKKQDNEKFFRNIKVSNNSGEIQKNKIDNVFIDKTLLSNLKTIIDELIAHRKLIKVIKDKLDKLFIGKGI